MHTDKGYIKGAVSNRGGERGCLSCAEKQWVRWEYRHAITQLCHDNHPIISQAQYSTIPGYTQQALLFGWPAGVVHVVTLEAGLCLHSPIIAGRQITNAVLLKQRTDVRAIMELIYAPIFGKVASIHHLDAIRTTGMSV